MKLTIKNRVILIRIGKILVFSAAILAAAKLTLEFATVTSASTAAFSFLIIVLMSAFFGDLAVAIVTSITATLCFNYFYLPPVRTFNIAAFSDWVSLAAFLLASIIISRHTASAAENMEKANILKTTLAQLKEFGERLLASPTERLTLSGISREALHIFSLEYCSIHVYSDGKWKHFIGAAGSDISAEYESRLKLMSDHSMNLMDLADESMLDLKYMQINKGKKPVVLLAVKSSKLPIDAIGTIAYMIGIRLNAIAKK